MQVVFKWPQRQLGFPIFSGKDYYTQAGSENGWLPPLPPLSLSLSLSLTHTHTHTPDHPL